MPRIVKFWLLPEGASDRGLVPHLEALCQEGGADEAIGMAPDLGRLPVKIGKSVREQLQAALQYGTDLNLLFVHRDADAPDPVFRREMVEEHARGCRIPCVPVIPVQELEAWLLLDEAAIRTVAGNPRGRSGLQLPSLRTIESTREPKEVLKAAILRAADQTGRQAERIRKRFDEHREALLQRLDRDGPVRQLPSFQRLVADIQTVMATLPSSSG